MPAFTRSYTLSNSWVSPAFSAAAQTSLTAAATVPPSFPPGLPLVASIPETALSESFSTVSFEEAQIEAVRYRLLVTLTLQAPPAGNLTDVALPPAGLFIGLQVNERSISSTTNPSLVAFTAYKNQPGAFPPPTLTQLLLFYEGLDILPQPTQIRGDEALNIRGSVSVPIPIPPAFATAAWQAGGSPNAPPQFAAGTSSTLALPNFDATPELPLYAQLLSPPPFTQTLITLIGSQ